MPEVEIPLIYVKMLDTNGREGDKCGLPVDTSGVCLPHVDDSTRHRTADVHINILHLDEAVDTIRVLLLADILAHHLAPDIVRTVGDGGGQNRAGVATKDDGVRRVERVIKESNIIVVDGLPFLESS